MQIHRDHSVNDPKPHFVRMPELPEVETVCRGSRPSRGCNSPQCHRASAQAQVSVPPDSAMRWQGKNSDGRRRAKYILLEMEKGMS